MLETASVDKKIPPPLPPKTRRGCLKNGDGGGGATILSNGHVVKIRIDRPATAAATSVVAAADDEQHAIGRRSASTVKINITCVDPFMYRYKDDADVDDEYDEVVGEKGHGRRRSSSGHSSPLDSGTGSDLETGSRRDESDDGTCSCDSLTSSTSSGSGSGDATRAAAVVAAAVAAVVAADAGVLADNHVSAATAADEDATATGVVATASVATVVEELPKQPSPPAVRVQQRCYGDVAATTGATAVDRVIDMENTDQYYNFHMNENVFDEADAATASRAAAAAAAAGDDSFAGCRADSASDTIRSAKGTIRGVKNRVRAGIATFLQPKTSKVSPVSILLIDLHSFLLLG